MKKIFSLVFLCIFLISCEQNTNTSSTSSTSSATSSSNNLANDNNSEDSAFAINNRTTNNRSWFSISVPTRNGWINGHKRLSGESGIIGQWIKKGEYNEQTLTFNTDGTFSSRYIKSVYQPASGNNVTNTSGTFEIYKQNNNYKIKMHSGSYDYDLLYLVSNNYLCAEPNGSPL